MLSKREKVLIAVLGSLLLHALILLLLGLSLRAKAAPVAATDESIKIEITPPEEVPPPEIPPPDLAPTPPAPFVQTHNTNASPPPDHAFESDNNSVAASELPATGLAPVPTQEGKKIPEFNFATTSYTAGDHPAESASSSAQAKPPAQPPAPEQTPPPDPPSTPPPKTAAATPTPEPTPERPVERDEFAMLGPTPTPHPMPKADEDPFDPNLRQPRTEPPRPIPVPRRALPVQPPSNPASSGYQAMTQKAAMSGAITNRGPTASVAALGTPMGRYKKALTDAIGSRWYYYMGQREDVASFGTVKIHFVVDSNGKVRRPQVISNTGNSTLENVSIQAILDANIPPIPPEVSALINSNQMDLDFSFALVDF